MGFKDYLKSQLLDIIEWEDTSQDTIVHKIDMRNNEIQNGAWLTVRPGQCAVFVDEGQIADIFYEGRHRLTTQNLPILTNLKHWAYGFNSPFKSDVYFVNIKQFMNQKWGTPTPIPVSDPKFEQVEVRAFGTFGFRVADPAKFMREVVSTNKQFKTKDIQEQLRAFVNTHFASIVGSLNLTVVDYAKNYNNIANAISHALAENFGAIGLEITAFTVSSITLPEDVNKVLRTRTKANMLGGLGNYAQVESLDIMRESVKNPGMNSMNQAGMGLGMGFGLGQVFAGNMQSGFNNQTQFYQPQNTQFYNPQQGQQQRHVNVPQGFPNLQKNAPDTQFENPNVSPETPGNKQEAPAPQPQQEEKESVTPVLEQASAPSPELKDADIMVLPCTCGFTPSPTAKFCMNCGAKVVRQDPLKQESLKDKFCPECGNKNDWDAKFCDECGYKF